MLSRLKRKYTRLISDKSFSEILTGSAFALVGRVVGTGLALVASLIVARVYGAEMMGILAIVQAFIMMSSTVALMGTNVSILRLIPEHQAKHSITSAFRVYRKLLYFAVLFSILVGGVLFACSDAIADKIFSKPHLSFYIGITSLCILLRSMIDLNTQAIRGLRLIRTFSFMQTVPNGAFMLILLVMIVFSGQENDPVYAQLAGWGVAGLLGVLIMNRAFRLRVRPGDAVQPAPLRQLLAISTPMMMTTFMTFVIAQTGVLILGMYRPEAEVGYYSAAVKLATLTSFILQAINSMAAPKFSELFHTGRMDELFYVARKSTKLIFWTTTPILLFLVALGRPVLSFFGEGFAGAYLPMLILVVGQFVNSISGSTGYFMNMTGHQGVFRNIIGLASGVNLLLGFGLIPSLGLNGAAIAATFSLALWNFLTLIYIKFKYGRIIGYFPIPSLKIFTRRSAV